MSTKSVKRLQRYLDRLAESPRCVVAYRELLKAVKEYLPPRDPKVGTLCGILIDGDTEERTISIDTGELVPVVVEAPGWRVRQMESWRERHLHKVITVGVAVDQGWRRVPQKGVDPAEWDDVWSGLELIRHPVSAPDGASWGISSGATT